MKSSNHILCNMFRSGAITGGDEVAKFLTFDGQYIIELNRENYQLWCTDNSYKYRCMINIYNNITNSLIVSACCTEEDIMNILDCYTQMCDFGTSCIYVPPLKPYNSIGNYYIITLEGYRVNPLTNIMDDISKRWFGIKEYNPMLQATVDIISIELDMSEMEDLMDLMYFIFLIDLESEHQLMPIDGMAPSEYTRYVMENSRQ